MMMQAVAAMALEIYKRKFSARRAISQQMVAMFPEATIKSMIFIFIFGF
jgi:hypothetical protein